MRLLDHPGRHMEQRPDRQRPAFARMEQPALQRRVMRVAVLAPGHQRRAHPRRYGQRALLRLAGALDPQPHRRHARRGCLRLLLGV